MTATRAASNTITIETIEMTFRPPPSAAITLFRQRFLNRTDAICFKATWGSPSRADGGDNLDTLFAAHVGGNSEPDVTITWRSLDGKSGTETGRFRIGSYCPALDGRTVFACVDCDGSGHGKPLADPLGAALAILDVLERLGLTAYLERSGGGQGWHVWIFFSTPVQAAMVRRLLHAIIPRDIKFADGTAVDPTRNVGIEVFPKQDVPDNFGNQVWLPWWHGAKDGGNLFYRVADDGEVQTYLPLDFVPNTEADLERAAPPPEQNVRPSGNIKGRTGESISWDGERVSADTLIRRALLEVKSGRQGGRNDGGKWLAIQLRDNGYSKAEAEAPMLDYLEGCPTGEHAYTKTEALATLRSIYSKPARKPWTKTTPPEGSHQQQHHDNGHAKNGDKPGILGADRTALLESAKQNCEQAPQPKAFPLGPIVLRPGQSRKTQSGKLMIPVAVLRDGKLVDEFQLSNSISGRSQASKLLLPHVGDSAGALPQALAAIIVHASSEASESKVPIVASGTTIRDLLLQKIPPLHELQYRTERGAWSAKRGNVTRHDFIALTPGWLMEQALLATDAPSDGKGAVNRTRLLRAIEVELKILWSDLLEKLPAAPDADLAADSHAGRLFRQAMLNLWRATRTFEVTKTVEGTSGEAVASRTSLISRIKRATLPYLQGKALILAREKWRPAQQAFDAWWRPEKAPDSEVAILLGMRAELMGQIGVALPDVTDQASLTSLGAKFGVIDLDPPVTPKLSGGHARIAVLSPSFTRELLSDPTDDDDSGTGGQARPVPEKELCKEKASGGHGDTADGVTGENWGGRD